MTRPLQTALIASSLLAIAELALLLSSIAIADSPLGLAVVLSSAALVTLLLTARSIYQEEYGSAIAWGYVALSVAVMLFLFEVPLVHLSRLFGNQQCDRFAGGCGQAQFPFLLPLLLTVGSIVFTLKSLRQCKRVMPEV